MKFNQFSLAPFIQPGIFLLNFFACAACTFGDQTMVSFSFGLVVFVAIMVSTECTHTSICFGFIFLRFKSSFVWFIVRRQNYMFTLLIFWCQCILHCIRFTLAHTLTRPVYSKHLHQKQVLKILWRVKMVGIHFWVIKPIVTCCISIPFSMRFECVLVSINCQLLIQVEHMPTKMWSLWSRFLLFGPFRKKKIFLFLRTKCVNQFTQHAMKSAQLWCRFAHTWYVVVRSAITSFGDDVDQHIAVLFPLNKSLLIRKARFSAPGAVHCHCVNLHRKPGNPKKSNADGQSHCLDAHINEAHLIRCELIKIQTPTSRVLIYKFD